MTIRIDRSHYQVPLTESPFHWVFNLTEEQLEVEASGAEDMRETRKCDPLLPLTRYELAEAVIVERGRRRLKIKL